MAYYAARAVARIEPAASTAATPRSEPRRPSSLRVGERLGDTRVYCLLVSCRRRRVSWLRSLDRDESEIDRVVGATYSLLHERRPPAMLHCFVYLVKLVGCRFLSYLPPPMIYILSSSFFNLGSGNLSLSNREW